MRALKLILPSKAIQMLIGLDMWIQYVPPLVIVFFLVNVFLRTNCKQRSVALSSTKSEYMAIIYASTNAMWLQSLSASLNCPQTTPTLIYILTTKVPFN